MNKRQAARLLKLATFLSGPLPGIYDQRCYYEQRHTCGTAACALGWACTIPSFQRAGLELGSCRYGYGDSRRLIPIYHKGKLSEVVEIEAGVEFFGLNEAEGEDLFGYPSPDEDDSREERVRRIIAVVAKRFPALATAYKRVQNRRTS